MTTTPQTNSSLEEIARVIAAHDNFVICGHVSPDGDCLGSQLALYHALRAMGKHASCVLVNNEPVGRELGFLPGIADMVPAESYEGPCDVFIGVDVPTRERIGHAAALLDASAVSITVDHHAVDTTMCDYVYVDPDSASASMLVWRIVKLLVEEPPVQSALCAYTGLVTDTGGFRFQNSDSEAFRVAGELVSLGVNPGEVASEVFQNRSLASLELEAMTIGRMRVFAGGSAAISWVFWADLERFGAVKSDVEPLIDVVRSLEGVKVACILREQQEGPLRGSLRSTDGTDVSALAREFGGGGHKAAAGFSLDMPLLEGVDALMAKIEGIVGR